MAIEYPSQTKDVAARHMAYAFQEAFRHRVPPGVEFLAGGGVKMVTGEPHPFGNFAIGQSDDEVEELAKELKGTGAPACLLFVDGIRPEAEAAARREGFEHLEQIPAMAVDLEALTPVELPEGYRYERFAPGDDATDWARAFGVGYELPQVVANAFSPLYIPVDPAEDARFQFFRVRRGVETAAVSALITGEGVAGIYCVAVVPDHRRRGLGAFLTAEPLRFARSLGLKVGVLQASAMGYSVYKKLGFEDVGAVGMLLRMP